MLRISALLLVAMATMVGGHDGAENAKSKTATVRIVPVYEDGTALSPQDLEVERFASKYEGTDLASHFKAATGSEIPYGVYRARIRMNGFWSVDRDLYISQPDVIAVTAFDIGMGKNEGGLRTSDLKARLRGGDLASGAVLIRLSGVYSSMIMDAEVNQSGDFSLLAVPDGQYTLSITQNGKVLSVQSVALPLKQSGWSPAPLPKVN